MRYKVANRSETLRRLVPYVEFEENFSYCNSDDLHFVEALLGYQYNVLECDEKLAKDLSRIFSKRSFELIIDSLATALGVTPKSILFFDSAKDHFVLKSAFDADANMGYRSLLARFSPQHGKAWLIPKEVMETEEAINFLVTYYAVIVDLGTKTIWTSSDDLMSFAPLVKPDQTSVGVGPDYLDQPVVFTAREFKRIYDDRYGEGVYRIECRGLRVYDPTLKDFEKFNANDASIETRLKTLMFQVYMADKSLIWIEVDLEHRTFLIDTPNSEPVLDNYKQRYPSIPDDLFKILGNEK